MPAAPFVRLMHDCSIAKVDSRWLHHLLQRPRFNKIKYSGKFHLHFALFFYRPVFSMICVAFSSCSPAPSLDDANSKMESSFPPSQQQEEPSRSIHLYRPIPSPMPILVVLMQQPDRPCTRRPDRNQTQYRMARHAKLLQCYRAAKSSQRHINYRPF
jgi:hypothetical protein